MMTVQYESSSRWQCKPAVCPQSRHIRGAQVTSSWTIREGTKCFCQFWSYTSLFSELFQVYNAEETPGYSISPKKSSEAMFYHATKLLKASGVSPPETDLLGGPDDPSMIFLFCVQNSHFHNASRSVGRALGLRVVVVIDLGHQNSKSNKTRTFGPGWRLLAEYHHPL